jgi:tetratricopeptide (TPR) repeat protein
MEEQDRHQWAERTVRAVNAALPVVEHRSWPQWEQILVHILACTELIEQQDFHFAEVTHLCQQTGWYLAERARYQEAEPLLEKALQMSEREYGSEHLDVARDAATLGWFYRIQGQYSQAEPLLKRALAIREQQLGPQHPNTALSVWWLAALSEQQQQYEKATSLYQRALSINERALGPQHPTTQSIRANYARLLRTIGHDAEAAALNQL